MIIGMKQNEINLMIDKKEYLKNYRKENRERIKKNNKEYYFQSVKNCVRNETYKNWVKRGAKYGFIDRLNDDMKYWEENPNE